MGFLFLIPHMLCPGSPQCFPLKRAPPIPALPVLG